MDNCRANAVADGSGRTAIRPGKPVSRDFRLHFEEWLRAIEEKCCCWQALLSSVDSHAITSFTSRSIREQGLSVRTERQKFEQGVADGHLVANPTGVECHHYSMAVFSICNATTFEFV
jgi:hypothetical protein